MGLVNTKLNGERRLRNAAFGVAFADLRNLIVRQYGAAMGFAPEPKFWSEMGPMVISARQSLRVQARAIPITPRQSFGVQATSATIAGCGADTRGAMAGDAIDDQNPARATASLRDHIRRIVGCRAEKQMIRSNARRIVAMVADHKPFWDGSIGQLPRHDMSGADARSVKKLAISVTRRGAPNPAIVRPIAALDLLPKAFGRWSFLGRVVAGLGAILSCSVSTEPSSATHAFSVRAIISGHVGLLSDVSLPGRFTLGAGFSVSPNYTVNPGYFVSRLGGA